MSDTVVSVKDLSVTRATTLVLRRISFRVERGKIVGLIGPSGSGKTTLMRSIIGLQKVSSGSVEVIGLAAGSAALRNRIGYMAQAPSVYQDLSVAQNITYFARILDSPKSEVERVIGAVDLKPQRAQLVGTLSGGQRTRVSLAVALLGRPRLLVLDEPTVGLDPILRDNLWKLFRELRDDGVTILLSSHVMEEASRCDHLLLMRGGRLIANDSVEQILSSTGTADVEAAFLQLVAKKDRASV
jgi:ABC-2 type transport system ATP-binding protein